jgi:hypothetical protein
MKELEQLAEDPSQKHPHLAACPRCQADLAMLREFESAAALTDEGAAVAWISSHLERRLDQIKSPLGISRRYPPDAIAGWFSRLFGSGSARWLIPVATVAVIAAVSVILLHTSKQPQLRADLVSGPTVYRSQAVEVIGPSGELSEAPKDLQWKPYPSAAQYKVSIMEVDRVALWSGTTNYTSLTIQNSTRIKMVPGKPVLWQVSALDSQGRVLAVSQVQRFSVARKSSSLN